MNNDTRGLLIQAEQAREKGDFKKSLELLADAIVVIVEEETEERLVDALSSQALCYRHLFDKTNSKNYLTLAKHSAMASVELAKERNDATQLAVSIYNLGKVMESLGESKEAIRYYRDAISQNINRLAMLAEMKTRLSVLEYKNGDATAMERFGVALKELHSSVDPDNYTKNVWLSGAYMHMADAIIGKDNQKAKEMLSEAEKVISSDMRLKLRKEQLFKLQEKLISNS